MKKIELIYPKLSYQLIGLVFEIYNELGYGYKEKYYQMAYEKLLISNKIKYQKEVPVNINFKGEKLATVFLDFLVDDKIIIELKSKDRFGKNNIEQVYNYLKANGKKLGILINFTREGVKYKRIVNIH